MGVTSHHRCHIVLVRSRSQVSPRLNERVPHKGDTGIIGGILEAVHHSFLGDLINNTTVSVYSSDNHHTSLALFCARQCSKHSVCSILGSSHNDLWCRYCFTSEEIKVWGIWVSCLRLCGCKVLRVRIWIQVLWESTTILIPYCLLGCPGCP